MKTFTAIAKGLAGEKLVLPCSQCKGETEHVSLASVERQGVEKPYDIHWVETHQVLQCRGCKAISYRRADSNSEDIEQDQQSGGYRYAEHVKYFPPRAAARDSLTKIHDLPLEVANIYDETFAAFHNSQPILTGVGIRAILETLCSVQKAKGGNLHQKIESLVSAGLLSTKQSKILHQLRELGNLAAHEVVQYTGEQLAIAMDVVEHLIKEICVIGPKAKQSLPKLKRPRQKKRRTATIARRP